MRAPKVRYHCPREWESLAGDRLHRHCPGCDETVTNISAMEPSAARRFVEDHPDACLRFRADPAGRIVFDRRHLAVLATVATLAGCASWAEAEEVVAPPDALAHGRVDVAIPDDEDEDDTRVSDEERSHVGSVHPPHVDSAGARSSQGASAVSAPADAAPHDPDPPQLRRKERPPLSRRELRGGFRRRQSVTMGR